MLNLVWVRTFLTLLQTQSFQLTAEQLGLAQPTVTQHIQKLEKKLGMRLFDRSQAGCRPTRQALVLVPHAHGLMRLNDRALAVARGESLRIGASSNAGIYLLPRVVGDFLRSGEAVDFDLVIDRNPVIAARLDSGEVDVAVMEWWDDRPGFAVRCWRREPIVVIMRPDHVWAGRSGLTRSDLAGVELLGGESGTGTGRLLRDYFAGVAELPRTSWQLGSTEAVKQAVKAGLGISVVMASAVADEAARGSLCAVPLLDPPLEKPIYLAWRADGSATIPSRFVDYLSQPAEATLA